ncbi:MAG TPA: head maturation protease, ClpP-related [Vicinamibacterales bacterium]|jgi:ATP-dependent protease ClpP protease subunit|nr:head maturation protease, ClpP-related [Vicinamibacterales bacterium]
MKAKWFRFQNAADDPTVADIYIFNDIGGWFEQELDQFWAGASGTTTASAFLDQLAQLSPSVTTIRVHLNSAGGDYFAAVAITSALRDQASKGRVVETHIDGLAASSASVIAMAGSKVVIADNGALMIHNPEAGCYGSANDMRSTGQALDAIRDNIVATYRWHSQLSADEIIAMMDAATWMDAEQAIANGFCTDKVTGLKAVAKLDPKITAKLVTVPAHFKDRVAAFEEPSPVMATAPEILAAATEAGLDLAFANALLATPMPLDQVKAKVSAEQSDRAARAQREQEAGAAREASNHSIRAVCVTAKLPQYADKFIAAGMAVEHVRAIVTDFSAQLDKVEIETTLQPNAGGQTPTAKVDLGYDKLNQKG